MSETQELDDPNTSSGSPLQQNRGPDSSNDDVGKKNENGDEDKGNEDYGALDNRPCESPLLAEPMQPDSAKGANETEQLQKDVTVEEETIEKRGSECPSPAGQTSPNAENPSPNGVEGAPDETETIPAGPEYIAPFPASRVKRIMKLDPDIRLVASDGIVITTQATALFLESLSAAAFSVMLQNKRKSIRGQDVILGAKSSRRFRDCVGNDLVTLLDSGHEGEESEEDGDGADGEKRGNQNESISGRPHQKRAPKKLPSNPPPGSRCITDFF